MSWAFVAVFFIPDIGVIAFYESIQDSETSTRVSNGNIGTPTSSTPRNPGTVALNMRFKSSHRC